MPADVVSIAATTAGVTGTITVGQGARLKTLRLAWTQAGAAELPQIVEISWASSPQPLRFVPPAVSFLAGTPAGAGASTVGCIIELDVTVKKADTVTIKITSSGNLTVKVGLEWN